MIRPLASASDAPGLDPAGLDDAYAPPPGRWVRANFAMTVDGAVEIDGRSGSLGGPDDKVLFGHLRGLADVVLVGSGTVRTEKYGAVRLDGATAARRATRRQATTVPIAVVTSRAGMDPGQRLFTETSGSGAARTLVLTCEAAPTPAREALARVAEVVVCGGATVDDRLVIDALVQRGLRQVLCEGGPTVLTRLLRAGLLDELCLSIAPVLAGPGRTGLGAGDPLVVPAPMTLTHLLGGDGGTLFARYRIDDRDTSGQTPTGTADR